MDPLFGAFLGSTASKNVSMVFLTDEDILTKMCWSRQKRASRSLRSEEKHIDFDLSTGEEQDLNFNVTTGGAQDEAKVALEKVATLELRVNKNREELVRSEESSQESESSAADARDN